MCGTCVHGGAQEESVTERRHLSDASRSELGI